MIASAFGEAGRLLLTERPVENMLGAPFEDAASSGTLRAASDVAAREAVTSPLSAEAGPCSSAPILVVSVTDYGADRTDGIGRRPDTTVVRYDCDAWPVVDTPPANALSPVCRWILRLQNDRFNKIGRSLPRVSLYLCLLSRLRQIDAKVLNGMLLAGAAIPISSFSAAKRRQARRGKVRGHWE
ncbi:hypothetical protein GQ53DRAFT_437274 [Thozetella sp. PMI_491]|nr:hypothetical protein GQ53DRAFT_437274 [Thozetella sp. PMI_491]